MMTIGRGTSPQGAGSRPEPGIGRRIAGLDSETEWGTYNIAHVLINMGQLICQSSYDEPRVLLLLIVAAEEEMGSKSASSTKDIPQVA
jgi:hypothetical protein